MKLKETCYLTQEGSESKSKENKEKKSKAMASWAWLTVDLRTLALAFKRNKLKDERFTYIGAS